MAHPLHVRRVRVAADGDVLGGHDLLGAGALAQAQQLRATQQGRATASQYEGTRGSGERRSAATGARRCDWAGAGGPARRGQPARADGSRQRGGAGKRAFIASPALNDDALPARKLSSWLAARVVAAQARRRSAARGRKADDDRKAVLRDAPSDAAAGARRSCMASPAVALATSDKPRGRRASFGRGRSPLLRGRVSTLSTRAPRARAARACRRRCITSRSSSTPPFGPPFAATATKNSVARDAHGARFQLSSDELLTSRTWPASRAWTSWR